MTDTVALQLYTVRDETAKDFKGTLRAVAEIGYKGVEFAGYGNFTAQELASVLAEYKLHTVGSHVSLVALEKDVKHEIAYCQEIGSPYVIVPHLNKEILRQPDSFKKFAEQLNEYGRLCQAQGLTLAYHNHDFEFEKIGEETLLDRLVAATDPALVKFELDTYWAAFAGIDPIAFLHKYRGRIATIHLKDMTPERTFTEVGEGTLDIAGYIEAGQAAGATAYIVENDQPTIPSLESARISLQNLHRSLT
ncbi:sugar phosphate isomerase/epimerase family protein [Dictyobacter arantiisoli]|uniref:Sugar phosphate isomerase n=1 Tax=Dictyobacter arantiisoli TaxID=2014874 RepID=A0A5A5T7G7_9CHLR|nr:sugar phosphate isomerase/epimerase [Dictyobacter arantiisoli]GCF07420.1 sugar phosphate isomerase [Dictyobacter arantiisoli]